MSPINESSSLLPEEVSPTAARRAELRRKWKTTAGTISWLSKPHRPTRYSVVVAPDGEGLAPQTQLYGSSKIAANAFNAEYRSSRNLLKQQLPASNRNIDITDEEADADETELADVPHLEKLASTVDNGHTLEEIEEEYREKTQTTFINDAMTFAEGTIPQSIIVATVIGIVCGVVAYLYYTIMNYFVELIWTDLPEKYVVDHWPEHLHVLWIPLVTFTFSTCCGLSICYLGEPGDLAYTIQSVHEKGYKRTNYIIPMLVASMFSILAGSSLGPEAPLVAICAATAGFISRKVFKRKNRNVIRKHTFMGMSGALSAFFGVPLGGSLFALEVVSRFGVEYFEHLIEAIFAGEICVVVFRWLADIPLEPIWEIMPDPPAIRKALPYHICLGAFIGLLGAFVAFVWANFHWRLMAVFKNLGLLDDDNVYATRRCLVAAVGVASIGMLVPHTMFWSEFEFGVISSLSPASKLQHVWPTTGLIGFEMDSWQTCCIVGFSKLIAISLSVAGGYRGGYIFPFFSAGAAFGRAFCFAFPSVSPIIATLCFAAGINVAITRTALATSLILAFLSGEQMALPAILASAIISLFATGYMPFIKAQLTRSDIDFSLFYRKNRPAPVVQDSFMAPKGQGVSR
mmetsp:Transcript_8286/g.17927  ORF Transcript_8286/g.17927 Transcript_8286/m.17927 type:complete len:629 (+) Transcript_8286:323-2209(+)|eukprot:CAMPEP_0183737390 /NCGR_PEP_ID=MMETSP0737-20130205/51810_1 /TAXON_ID=385413 /ORGANISM="Thalassiosira miniscula, Strain CCMP1093" /LENGTH=628 /DNA_ID=CAMNT_0025971655 /DNA_START=241 /DNA_END=2127 /DNA_ORIENTATION=-